MTTVRPESRLQQSLDDVTRVLDRHRVLETLTHRQEGPKRDLLESLQHRQNPVELHKRLRAMHPADVAFVLEALPPVDRQTVWDQIDADKAGLVFVEVSSAVRAWLVERTQRDALVALLTTLDPEDLGYISEDVPPEVLEQASRTLESRDRQAFEATIQYDEGQIGHHMTHGGSPCRRPTRFSRRSLICDRVPSCRRRPIVSSWSMREMCRADRFRCKRCCWRIPLCRCLPRSKPTQRPSARSIRYSRRRAPSNATTSSLLL